ncbi:MAG: magnesium transporter [Deltaproteobacteria bacterium]|nr:magnesium transporter [Deltaproteobacteria bacterium]
MFIYFTELVSHGVYDRHHRWVGRPYDFCIRPRDAYPPTTALLLRRGRWRPSFAHIPWDQVQLIRGNGRQRPAFQLKIALEQLVFQPAEVFAAEFRLRRHVLDQQVVDTFNRKVVRVNDVHLLRVDNDLRVAHVDVGLRGIIRRLGWAPAIDRFVRWFFPNAAYLTHEGFIGWKYIQPLATAPERGTLPLTVPQEELRRIPPADLSEILLDLDPYQRVALFTALDAPMQGNILSEMDLKMQKELIAELDTRTGVEVFERMPEDKAADLLQVLSRREADRILTMMTSRKAKKLSRLLAHKSRSAGGLMTTEFITLPASFTVAEAIEQIKAMTGKAETVYYTYVTDAEQRLEGTVTFRELLVADPQQSITAVMAARPIAVHVNASAKEVAYVLDKYNLFAVPVIDDERVIQGMITIDDVLSLVISETWGKKTGLL